MSSEWRADHTCLVFDCYQISIQDHVLCALHELRYIANKGKPSPIFRHTKNGLATDLTNNDCLNFIFSMKYGFEYDHDAQFPRLKP